MWDDGLVEAWETGQRFTLLMVVDHYPAHIDRMRCYVGSGPHYKPSLDTIEATTRSVRSSSRSVAKPLDSFYLSGPISNYLKSFGRCYKLRTAFELNWNDADAIGLDEMQSHRVFQDNWHPPASRQWDEMDPVVKGFQLNVPLVTFWWALRRFTTSPNYCLVRDPLSLFVVSADIAELRRNSRHSLIAPICLRQASLSIWVHESRVSSPVTGES